LFARRTEGEMATYGYGMDYGQDWGGAITTQFMSLLTIPKVRLKIETQIIGIGEVLVVLGGQPGIGTQIISVGGVFTDPNIDIGGVQIAEGD
jgi:hypothetical protein